MWGSFATTTAEIRIYMTLVGVTAVHFTQVNGK